jgi:hypothetical protein
LLLNVLLVPRRSSDSFAAMRQDYLTKAPFKS